ncbi:MULTISPECIES: hypothetical protein [unclassified Capnocytophaga]|uniref:hypothetical protein n=1 Tax=unclassified Capnocytophaga TaxID=2640652 RepID=UPI000202D6A9|nr:MULTISPECIES: hypothetical protein [unclassified Capnocytophaga]EGD33833.1 hypothetical protein HMPREF9071_1550 [Capnocytophaga sp. oral taxon 338 str. F0234]MEB3004954.1 hypothetical protein [Capnocytophaga sp. G2]
MKLKSNFLSKRTIGILFCILLAALSWFVGNLSKRSTQQYTVKVSYKDLPSQKFMTTEAPSSVRVELEGVGFSLFKYAISTPTITISFNELKRVKHDKYMFNKNLISQINKQYFPDVSVLSLQPDTLKIHFQKIDQKRVPVKVQFLLPLPEDYRIESYQIFPDSVLISGLEHELDTVTGVYLYKKGKKNITKSFSGEIPLKSTAKIHYNAQKVSFSVQIVHVTEEKIETKVQLLHQPFSADVKLFPEEISILVSGNLEIIRDLKPTDIIVVADYRKRNDTHIPLEIYKKPASIEVSLSDQKEVEYLIVH